ncbi:hypothetical protein LCGC14_2095530 [marine sediment metagenome]|uniref:Uncharacterized protein n=1 Tax=marine sediment metagenome TaxID=412755 RepID=A0A0F9EBG2_9ZZZZ
MEKLISRDAKITLLEAYSLFLEDRGYLDIDWRVEEPYAIDEFLAAQSKFRPVPLCFEKSDTIRARHLLWEDFRLERTDLKEGTGVHKVAFYLWLADNDLCAKQGKDKEGNLGYRLKYIPNEQE